MAKWQRPTVIITAVLATLFAFAAIVVFEGYVPAADLDGLTSTDLGVLSGLMALIAVIVYATE
jgi:hypothetical protein